jgi:site-specific recombinase XerD
MNGRLEKEIRSKEKMQFKLYELPEIFEEFYVYLNGDRKSYTTIERYINYVQDFMLYITKGKPNNSFYKDITPIAIKRYISSLETQNKNGEIVRLGDEIQATRWSALNTFFNFLTEEDYITVNPMTKTKRPKVKTKHKVTYLTPEEIQFVLNKIEKEGRQRLKNRDLCIVALGLSTGLRVSAIVQINIEYINFTTNKIKVIEKGNVTREVDIGNNMRGLLLNWIKDRELYFDVQDNPALFISQHNKRMCTDAVRDLIAKYTADLNKHITPHKLRSSAAMNLYSSGVGILSIASILGHENITTTQRYTSAYDEEKENATNILDNLI